MYAVVSGAGEVGFHVARALRREGHNVALIEPNKQVLDRVQDLDALLVQGNGASLDTLQEAGIAKADLFVGAAGDDEANMLGCAIAKQFGAQTIARINTPEFLDEPASTKYKSIGVDMAVSPELVAAQKVAALLEAPALASADIFAQGRVAVVETRLLPTSPAAGKTLADIPPLPDANVIAIMRGGDIIVPRGSDELRSGDRVFLCVLNPGALKHAEQALGLVPGRPSGKMRRVVIAGGSRVGVRLARLLERRLSVTIIEKDANRATAAFEQVKDTLVIHGDATDMKVLSQESVETADAFIGADAVEEYNILACLLAKRIGVPNTVAFVNQPQIKSLVEETGIDVALTVRETTASSLLRWCYQMDTLDLALIGGGQAQVIEIQVRPEVKIAGKPLKKIDFPRSSVVGAIVRKDHTLIPKGDDIVQEGDRLILLALTEAIPKLERLLGR